MVLSAEALGAQEVYGTLRRDVEGMPAAAGVLVVAEHVGDGRVVARTVTGMAGTYRLRVTGERVVVRSLRIGQLPLVLDTVQLAVGALHELSRTLPEAPVALQAARVVANARCGVPANEARDVASWFSDARTALIASQVDPPEGTVGARVRVVTRDGAQVTQRDEGTSTSLRPFRSPPLDSLERTGFVVTERDRTVRYRAPDADLLVDERFLARYCLHRVDAPDTLPGWIGLGFRPAERRRNLVEVRGTLWLDSASHALRRLEFGYVGADPLAERMGAGGALDYGRLDNGVWFVQRWVLRMPRVGEATVLRRRDMAAGSLREVTGVVVTEGEVLDVRVAGGLLFTVGDPDSGDVIGGEEEARGLEALRLEKCHESAGVSVVGYLASVSPTDRDRVIALPNAEVSIRSRERGDGAAGTRTVTVRTDAVGRFVACAVTPGSRVHVVSEVAGHSSARVLLQVPTDRALARVDLLMQRP
jgi:hypothetical protein